MKIAFFLPQNVIGGGQLTVYKHAQHLQQSGHDVSIIYHEYVKGRDTEMIRDFNFNILPFDENTRKQEFDIVFATWWEIVYDIFLLKATYYFYYNQDDERRFYKPEDFFKIKFCDLAYQIQALGTITVASWWQKQLQKEGSINAKVAPNGYDDKIFFPRPDKENKTSKLRVLIEGPGNVWFRRIDDCFKAIAGLTGVEVWFKSRGNFIDPSWKYDRIFHDISSTEMAEIYSSCDVLLKMSEVEAFCLPNLEMMGCGRTIITTAFTGHEEYAINGENSIVVPIRNIEAARAAVTRLRDDKALLARLQTNALATAKNMTWNIQVKKFEQALIQLTEDFKGYDYESVKKQVLAWRDIKHAIEISEREKQKLKGDYGQLFHQFHRNEYRIFRFIGRIIYSIPLLGTVLRKIFS